MTEFEKVFNTRIGLRYDSESNWQETNPILLEGELAISYNQPEDPNEPLLIRIKSGDGKHPYNELQYVDSGANHIHDINDVTGLQEVLNATIQNIIVAKDGGLKIINSDNKVIISLDETVTFVLDGGDSSKYQDN